MTDCGITTNLEGLGYHAFRGPRPVAWDQNLYYSDANWECKTVYIHVDTCHPTIPGEWAGIIILYLQDSW